MSSLYKDAIYWIETDQIQPNPYQPRKEFDESALLDLADSIRQYGILQPLVVTRVEDINPEGGMDVRYELIAGERRLRASKIAGLYQVPVIIRKNEDNKAKFELAIIENLQREDLNAIDRAIAFDRLVNEFGLTHAQVGKRMGKSREYVTNTLRLLALPEEIKQAVMSRRLPEGHCRPLLMLSERPEEQMTLFHEIVIKKLTVRDAERIARGIAQDKVRKPNAEPRDLNLEKREQEVSKKIGARVTVEKHRGQGGRLVVEVMSEEDIEQIMKALEALGTLPGAELLKSQLAGSIEDFNKKRMSQGGGVFESAGNPTIDESSTGSIEQALEIAQEQKAEEAAIPKAINYDDFSYAEDDYSVFGGSVLETPPDESDFGSYATQTPAADKQQDDNDPSITFTV